MHFAPLLKDDGQRKLYQAVCQEHSEYVSHCVKLLIEAYDATDRKGARDPGFHYVSILMLTRHVIECLDVVSVLLHEGCIPTCKLPMRSTLEAFLGVNYILDADTERRALAYQVAYAHERITLYERCDALHPEGQKARREIQNDLFAKDILDIAPRPDFTKLVANLQAMFLRPEYQPIEQEWQARVARAGSRRQPKWYSLFGGPPNVKELAKKVRYPAMYAVLYQQWSGMMHAGDALQNIAGGKGHQPSLRPIRHPEGLETMSIIAGTFALSLARRLYEVYSPLERALFEQKYGATQRARSALRGVSAEWRG